MSLELLHSIFHPAKVEIWLMRGLREGPSLKDERALMSMISDRNIGLVLEISKLDCLEK